MDYMLVIEIVGIIIAIIVGAFSIVCSINANSKSKKANEIAQDALELSQKINNQYLENISFEDITNPVILKKNVSIDYKIQENADYSAFYLILQIRINNKSFQPTTINEVSIIIGNQQSNNYFNMNDLVDIVSYMDFNKKIILKEVNEFPYYLMPNESKNITLVLGIEETDRIQFITSGCELTFKTSNKIYKTKIDGQMTIEK